VATLVQFGYKGAPHVKPHVFFFPLLESPPTGRGAGIFPRQVAPARTGFENPEDAFEHPAVVAPGPTATLILGEQRGDAPPLFVGEKKFCHPQLFTNNRAKYKVKITPKNL